MLVSQVVGAFVLLGFLAVLDHSFTLKSFTIGAAAGLAGFAGLILFFRALEGGVMSIVAPTTSAVAGLIPITAGVVVLGERPGPLGIVGAALALAAIALLSTTETTEESILDRRQSTVLAVLAGIGFGTFFIIIGQTDASAGLWPLAGARAVSIPIGAVLVLITKPARPQPGGLRIATASGVLDMGGNILTLLALQRGLLSLIGVLASLYPASTVVLARLVLHERMTRSQLTGIALALVGVALIAAA